MVSVIGPELRDNRPEELVQIARVEMVCHSVSHFVEPHDEIPDWFVVPSYHCTTQT
jgi:hypothetical protein